MPDKSRSSDSAAQTGSQPDVLRHHTPKGLKLAGFIALGVLALVIVWGLASRFYNDRQTRDWTKEQAATVVHLVSLQGSQSGDFTLPGDVEAFTVATIFAQITGYVQKWDVDIGTPVKAGQLLAQIDPKPYQAALDQAKGALARDSAGLTEAQLDLKRYAALVQQNAISAQQYTTQQATVASDTGVVETDQAAVETAQINLNYTRIVAPFDGVVTSRSLDVGQLVTAGNAAATPLFTVTAQDKLRVYVRVPQSYSGMIHPGMTVNFTVPEHPGRVFTAQLAASADAIVSQSGTQLVQFMIDNTDRALKPGDYAEMHFGTAKGFSGVRVPATALLFRDQGMTVAIVGPDSKVAIKRVHVSTDLGTAVDVDSGVKSGDKVIDNPPDSLRDGDTVQVAR